MLLVKHKRKMNSSPLVHIFSYGLYSFTLAFNTAYSHRGDSLENRRSNFSLEFVLHFPNKWLLVQRCQFLKFNHYLFPITTSSKLLLSFPFVSRKVSKSASYLFAFLAHVRIFFSFGGGCLSPGKWYNIKKIISKKLMQLIFFFA